MNREKTAASPQDEVSIRLLGGFEVLRAGRPAARPAYDKGRGLLAYLAAEAGGPHPRQKMAGMLWPGLTEESARTNLRQVVLNLRRVLGEPCLRADRESICIDPDANIRLDIAEFTAPAPACIAKPHPGHCEPCVSQMEGMADRYRGEFMAGFQLPDCPEFEDWLQIKREALHRHALAVLERLSDCLEQAGEPERALPYASRYAELEPWNERGQRRVMRLMVRTGQPTAALAHYRDYCRALEQELGVRPDEETQRLAAHIRGGDLAPASSQGPKPAPALPSLQAERRQVTVLYCELTPLSEHDPEEAMAQLASPQARCVDIVRGFGGHIVQQHGGGLLAYFGYPQASENAARQAVRAAQAAARETRFDLEIRAGIHTGIVITGGNPALPDTIGTTSALAIRLRRRVGAGEVAASGETMQLVSGYFECERVATIAGQAGTPGIDVFRVLGETGATSRLEARLRPPGGKGAGLLTLVGRHREIDALTALWDEVRRQRRGTAVVIEGEAGIGKSRLLLAFKSRVAATPCVVREMRCFPEFSRTPFQPLLSLPLGEDSAAIDLSAQRKREEMLDVLVKGVRLLAREKPVLFVAEDLHWSDASTLEVLDALAAQAPELPLLVLATARPEFDPPWRTDCWQTLPLAPLEDGDIAAMVAEIGRGIAPDTSARIVARADGVPLFAEEMARMALAEETVAIPATLHDLLGARLDAMAEAKRVAQLAAAIGREFDIRLLETVSGLPPASLKRTLIELRAAGVLVGAIGSTMQFKHALIQEASYQSQIKTDRQASHLKIAQALLDEFAELAEQQPEVVARHFALGGAAAQAIEQWAKAGQRAFQRSINAEAQMHFAAGLQLAATLPDTPERSRLEISLQLGLGVVLQATQGYGSKDAYAAFKRALNLCGSGEGIPALFQTLWGLWVSSMRHFPTALGLAQELCELARHADDECIDAQAHYAMGNNLFWTGDFGRAREHLERSIASCRPENRSRHLERYGEDAAVTSRCFLSWTLWASGFPDSALGAGRDALALARAGGQPHMLGYALALGAILHCWMRNEAEAARLADEAIAVAEAHRLPLWLAAGRIVRGWVDARQGRAGAVADMRESVEAMRGVMKGAVVIGLAMLAEACAHAGEDEAEVLADALGEIEANGDRHFVAELHRRRGECLLVQGVEQEAEQAFAHALAVSREQGARMLELRAAVSLARLWQRAGRRAKARRLLEPVVAGFTEGHDTADLAGARELLDALG